MIYYENNQFKPYKLKAQFMSHGQSQHQYTNDREYWESMANRWWYINSLQFFLVQLTPDQQARLDIANSLSDPDKEIWGGSYALFVEHGVINPDNAPQALADLAEDCLQKTLDYYREPKRLELKQARDSEISQPINGLQVARVEDRENINGAIGNFDALSTDGVIDWVLIDNSIQPMSLVDLTAVRDGYIARKAQAFGKYGVLCGLLNEAETVEDVLSITWSN